MDTKLRNTKTITWGISSILAVIAAEAVCFFGSALMIAYSFQWNAGYFRENPQSEEGGGTWYSFDTTGIEQVISDVWIFVAVFFLAALIFIAISLVAVGRKNDAGQLPLNWFDRIFTDVQILALIGIGVLIALLSIVHVDWLMGGTWYQNEILELLSRNQRELALENGSGFLLEGSDFEPRWLEIGFAVVGNILLMGLFLLIVQSLVKKLKARAFWKNTIIGRIVVYLYNAAKASEDVFWKLIGVAVAGALLSATWFGLIPVLILIFIFVPKWAKKYSAVKDGIEEIKSGNLNYKIPVESDGELDRLAGGINEIAEAMSIAVQNELKNQRMKTDLISNVSHDLRTPLTSMVSYVDLLKKEGLESENAPLYLEIIDEKTRRLRKLTDDLFEAAKASSGNIPVEITKIEMSSIVNQAIAETEERLAANQLEIIYTNRAEAVYVMADGQLFWRVIENLLTNVSKYALPGSRVYMDIREDAEMIYLDVKNMSKDQLNISADELMERFKRGDESRNTEGSGLGLSIAKDLTGLMNGRFSITIDGDLFKATVALRKSV